MKFHRWSGAGNTFFVMDAWNQNIPAKEYRSRLAKKICWNFPHAKTDGMFFLEKTSDFDFAWDFYNDDGSFAEMCGNAARCATAHFYKFVDPKSKLKFMTGAGLVESEWLSENEVLIQMPPLKEPGRFLQEKAYYINTGVPHIVLQENPDPVRAKKWRPLPDAAGSNVTFVTEISAHHARAVTFERGVEDFTAACGTGATAAAAYLQSQMGMSEVDIQMPGGTLHLKMPNSTHERPQLWGPVQHQFVLEP